MAATSINDDHDSVAATPPHDASIHERPTLPESIARDTIIASPSFPERVIAWLASIGRGIAMPMQRPRLSDHLPPVPASSSAMPEGNERAERLLLDIMRAPPEYVAAAMLIARATQALRKRGNDVFAEGFVAFALSRMPPDPDGTISVKRLREWARDVPSAKSIMPVLLRLEQQGIIAVEAPAGDTTTSAMIDMDRMRVRLLVLP
jgi:hypothetical protein